MDFHGPEQMKYKLDETLATEALLLGRNTYEGFAEAWPERDGEGGDILVAGSAQLVEALTEHGLVDEFRLMVFPVLIGTGKRVFPDALRDEKRSCTLADSTAFPSGVVVQTYHPA